MNNAQTYTLKNREQPIFDASKEQVDELQQKLAPMRNGSNFSRKKLHAGLKLKTDIYLPNGAAYPFEEKIIRKLQYEYLHKQFVYILYTIPVEQRPQHNGYAYFLEIYIEDSRIMRRRIENLFGRNLVWNIYEFNEADTLQVEA